MFSLKNRFTSLLLGLISLLGLGVFFCLSGYNHPTIDDFGYADFIRRKGFWAVQQYQYQHWSGRFTSTLLGGLLNPLIYSHWQTGIKLSPILFLASFTGVFHFFLYCCFNKQIGFRQLLPFSAVLVVCFVLELESVMELIYWFAASCAYGIPMVLFLFILVLFFRLFRVPGTNNTLAGIAILGIILCGTNELELINIVLLSLLVFTYLGFTRPRKQALAYLAVWVLIAGAALVALAAPGNLARAQTLPGAVNDLVSIPNLGGLLLTSAKFVLLKSKNWIFGLPLISGSLILAVLIWKQPVPGRIRFKNCQQLMMYILVVYVLLVLQLLPALYNKGLSGLADRAVNVVWFHFFCYWLIGLFLFLPYLKEGGKITVRIAPDLQARFFNMFLAGFLAAVLSSFHVVQAYQDLLFKAPAYDAGLQKRYDTFRQAKTKNSLTLEVVPVFPHPQDYPKTISKLELSEDSHDNFNSSVASYFGLRSVKLAAPPQMKPDNNPHLNRF